MRHEALSATFRCFSLESDFLSDGMGNAKITEDQILEGWAKHDVSWLDVSVHDPKKMHDLHAMLKSRLHRRFIHVAIADLPR